MNTKRSNIWRIYVVLILLRFFCFDHISAQAQPGSGMICLLVKDQNGDTIRFDRGRNEVDYDLKYYLLRQKSTYQSINDGVSNYSVNYLDQPIKKIFIRIGFQKMRILLINPCCLSNWYYWLFYFKPGTFYFDMEKFVEKDKAQINGFVEITSDDLNKR
jgi:hypothetical protein